MRGYRGTTDASRLCPGTQSSVVIFPNAPAFCLDRRPHFELRVEECRQYITHEIARTDIDPGILVHQPAKKSAAVGSLFANDFGALEEAVIVNQQRAAFPTGNGFGFMKALRCQTTEGAQPLSFVFAEQSVSVIFNDRDVFAARDFQDRIHFTSDTCVMNGDHRPGSLSDQRFERSFVEI